MKGIKLEINSSLVFYKKSTSLTVKSHLPYKVVKQKRTCKQLKYSARRHPPNYSSSNWPTTTFKVGELPTPKS